MDLDESSPDSRGLITTKNGLVCAEQMAQQISPDLVLKRHLQLSDKNRLVCSSPLGLFTRVLLGMAFSWDEFILPSYHRSSERKLNDQVLW